MSAAPSAAPVPVAHLSLLAPGSFADGDPATGLEDTLALFELGEELGYDGAWIRHRHLEPGVASSAVFLAAAGQRTRRVELGTAVIPIGYENPFRLAEDLSLADVLSAGRLQVGFSAGMPHADLLGDLVHEGDWRSRDLTHPRIDRLLDHLRAGPLGGEGTRIPTPSGPKRPRLQPHAAGLPGRTWYGGGSLRSARWAGERGLHLLTGNVVTGESSDDFATSQLALLEAHRAALPAGASPRTAVGRVVVPLDGADRATRARYLQYAADRYERTLRPQGERRTLFAPDVVGTSDEVVERLLADPVVAGARELRVELPYSFAREDYEQIITDVSTVVAPQLGWLPAPGAAAVDAAQRSSGTTPSATA